MDLCKKKLNEQLLSEDDVTKALENFDFSELLCSNAERKSYGLREKDSILYEDES